MFCEFKITEELNKKCTLFAEAMIPYSFDKYEERGQPDKEKHVKDNRNSKLAEEVAYEILSKRFPNISKPDYNVYPPSGKTWGPDLYTNDKEWNEPNDIGLAVKSHDMEYTREKSWVFQTGYNEYDCDEFIFKRKDPNRYAVFVSLYDGFGVIESIVNVQWLFDKDLFDHMRSPYLDRIKKAVYYDSPSFNNLKNYPDELWQLKD